MNIQELHELAEVFAESEALSDRESALIRDFLDGVSSGRLATKRSEWAIRWFKATGRLTGELRT